MARKRDLSPGFFKNEDLASLEPLARLLFQGLWCFADRNGNLENRPMRLKAEILPYEATCEQVASWLEQLAGKELIRFYEIENRKYINIVNFLKHQSPHPQEKAMYPLPVGTENARVTNNNLPVTCEQPADKLPESDQQPSYSLTLSPLAHPSDEGQSRKSAKAQRKPSVCDDDFLRELQANPAYEGLDVRRSYLKMVAWCEQRKKLPTRMRLVNWLNREEVPMSYNGANQRVAPQQRKVVV